MHDGMVTLKKVILSVDLSLNPSAEPVHLHLSPLIDGENTKPIGVTIHVNANCVLYEQEYVGWTSATKSVIAKADVKCCHRLGCDYVSSHSEFRSYGKHATATFKCSIFEGVFRCVGGGAKCFCCDGNIQRVTAVILPTKPQM